MVQKTKWLAFVLVLAIFSISKVQALEGSFADIGIGSRALAMGGAFSAISDDATALYWNPAGLAQLRRAECSVAYTDIFSIGLDYTFLSAALPFGKSAVSFGFLELSNIIDVEYQEKKYTLAVARQITPKLALGANLNSFRLQSTETAGGFGLDFGLQYKLKPQLTVGLIIRNLASNLDYSTGTKEDLSTQYRGGIAVKLTDGSIISAEADNYGQVSIGFEKKFSSGFVVRAGMKDAQFTGGIGLQSGKLRFDYAYNSHAIGDSHLLSTALAF